MGTNHHNKKNYGYRIYKLPDSNQNQNNNLTAILDFIIHPEGYKSLLNMIKKKTIEKGQIELSVYNIKSNTTRKETFYLEGERLGLKVKYENWSLANKMMLRFVGISKGSVLENEVVLNDDYLIGIINYKNEYISLNQVHSHPLKLMKRLLNENVNKNVKLIIFNIYNGVKEICIYVKSEVELGVELAYGYNHELR